MPAPASKKPVAQLRSRDGNVFGYVVAATSALKRVGLQKQADELGQKVRNSSSYDEALQIMMKYVDFD